MTLTRHSPPSIHRATRLLDACCVLETPPLPVTPPPRGDRGHDLMTESSLLTFSSTTLRLRVAGTPPLSGGDGAQRNPRPVQRFVGRYVCQCLGAHSSNARRECR